MTNLAVTAGREMFFLTQSKFLDFDTAYIFFSTVFLNPKWTYRMLWADHVFVAGLRKTSGKSNKLETEISLNIYLEHEYIYLFWT